MYILFDETGKATLTYYQEPPVELKAKMIEVQPVVPKDGYRIEYTLKDGKVETKEVKIEEKKDEVLEKLKGIEEAVTMLVEGSAQ